MRRICLCLVLLMFVVFLVVLCSCEQDAPAAASSLPEVADKVATTTEDVKVQEEVQGDYHFRKTRWGMTPEQVEQNEPPKLLFAGDGTYLACETELGSYKCGLRYRFIERQLASAWYMFRHLHSNPTDYISDYEELKLNLNSKYGAAEVDIVNWKNKAFESYPGFLGAAILQGHVVYTACWQTEDTEIILQLRGNNDEIKLVLNYSSKELKQLAEDMRNKKVLSDL